LVAEFETGETTEVEVARFERDEFGSVRISVWEACSVSPTIG
jgi:hypothetical protein